MGGAVSGIQFASLAVGACRRIQIAGGRRHPAQPVIRLGTFGMRPADCLIDVTALVRLANGKQTIGELQLCRHIVCLHAQRLRSLSTASWCFSLCRLNPPEVIEPAKGGGIQNMCALITDRRQLYCSYASSTIPSSPVASAAFGLRRAASYARWT